VLSGGQQGNKNAAKTKRWQKALERALSRYAGDVDAGLDKLADKVVLAADSGEVIAWKEIAERMDGKAQQTIDVRRSFEELTDDELSRAIECLRAAINTQASGGAGATEAVSKPAEAVSPLH
jgi:DNA topoisomerase IA